MKNQPGYLSDLTKNQLKAVTHLGSHLMIVAGAGTGKTTVLTRRIAWLIAQQRIKPENILALTFTEKAATEMETRLDELLPYGQTGTTVSTFHGFGNNILSQFPVESGVGEDTVVMTETEQMVFLREHIMELPLKNYRPLSNPVIHLRAIINFIGRCKDELISPQSLTQLPKSPQLDQYQELGQTYAAYQELLAKNNLLDYGELLYRTYNLLKNNQKVRQTLQKQYTHILVDEYQDTNYAQIELLKTLVGDHGHLTVVGDDDQSIYRFRGAEVGQMSQFKNQFKPASIVTLIDNFRSPQAVLDQAYELIQKNNPFRLEASEKVNKKLIANQARPHPNPILREEGIPHSTFDIRHSSLQAASLHTFFSDHAESVWVVEDIKRRIADGASPGDHCILVRTNMQSHIFQHELERQGVPYTTESKTLLTHDTTVKLLLNFLKTLTNPLDHLAFFFLATSPIYQIPGSDLVPILAEAKSKHQAIEKLIGDQPEPPLAPPLSSFSRLTEGQEGGDPHSTFHIPHSSLQPLLDDLKLFRDQLSTASTSEILLNWTTKHSLAQKLASESSEEDLRMANALTAFFTLIAQYERSVSDKSVFHFLDNLDILLTDFDADPDIEISLGSEAVKLFTIHMAKGLEFPVVYLTNLSADRFPTINRNQGIEIPPSLLHHPEDDGEHLREERRLMYVAMTRAKRELMLTRAEVYANGRPRKASVFLSEFNHKIIPPPENNLNLNESRIMDHESRSREDRKSHDSRNSKFVLRNSSLHLSPHQIEDYLTCPLRYKYAHIDKLPVPDEQPLMVGYAIHQAIEHYLIAKQAGKKVKPADLHKIIDQNWRSAGFISAEHERERLTDAHIQIDLLIKTFDPLPAPIAVEDPFEFVLGDVTIHGRIDASFSSLTPISPISPTPPIILDFKTSDNVITQEQADQRAKTSLQLTLYALAGLKKTGKIPTVGLYFTTSGLFAFTTKSQRQLDNAEIKVAKVAAGIRADDFGATPSQFDCSICPFRHFCPHSMAVE